MSNDKPQWGPYPYGPYPGAGQQWRPEGPAAAGPYGWSAQAAGPETEPPPAAEGRIDALDVLEGVLKDGFSVTNLTRIARASGSNFWVGAAIGAGLVVLANRPDVRAAVSNFFSRAAEPPKAEPKG
ncbi:hypothetical protein [Methylocella sp.]|uniref:hypothetical protein n=1 Tax=Methylocella sp. TaxID=1978226 RepID=UPI0037849FF2